MSTERRALESVSALIDGEANDLDLARVLKGGDESETMRAYWLRQQQYRAVMRSGASAYSAVDVSSGVTAAISEDQTAFCQPFGFNGCCGIGDDRSRFGRATSAFANG